MSSQSQSQIAPFCIVTLTVVTSVFIFLQYGLKVNFSPVQRSRSEASRIIPIKAAGHQHFVIGRNTGRLGNQLFAFAASLYVGRLTGREPALMRKSVIDEWFQTDVVKHIDSINTNSNFTTTIYENRVLAIDKDIAQIIKAASNLTTDIVLCGYFESWKYVNGIEETLRQILRPIETISMSVSKFLQSVHPHNWTVPSIDKQAVLNFWRIGIHIRTGDSLQPFYQKAGFVIPEKEYFVRAMQRAIRELYTSHALSKTHKTQVIRVQFFIVTESIEWVHNTFRLDLTAAEIKRNWSSSYFEGSDDHDSVIELDVVYSKNQNAGFDMVLLSRCDAVILTYGTYGWWSAWLANKTTIYFGGWPRKGSDLAKIIRLPEYYPPSWISL